MSANLCATPGCDNPVDRRPGRVGRPPVYCSPACRASRARRSNALEVEVDQNAEDEEHGRDWEVRIRRGPRVVVVQGGLGRFGATALASELRSVLDGRHRDEAAS